MKQIDKRVLAGLTIAVLFFFGTDVFIEYSNDTYAILEQGLPFTAADMMFRNGRPVISVFYWFWCLTPFSEAQFYYFSYSLAIIFLTAALYLLQDALKEFIEDDFLRSAFTFFMVVNVFFINFFSFLEKGMFMLGILFAVLAFRCEKSFFKDHNIKKALLALLFLILVMLDYQVMSGIYVMLSVIFAVRYAKDLKDTLLDFGVIFLSMALSCIPAVIIMKVGGAGGDRGRSSDISGDILRSMRNIIRESQNTFSVLPRYFWLVIAIFCLIFCCVSAFYKKAELKGFISILLVTLTGITLAFMFIFVGYHGYSTARTLYPMALIPGALLINNYVNCENDAGSVPALLRKSAVILVCIHLIFLCLAFTRIFINRYTVNRLDKYMILTIKNMIRNYEKESGNKVEKICFYEDRFNSDYYGDVLKLSVNVSSSMSADWSRLNAFNWYCGTDYEEGEPLQKYSDYFIEKDWSSFSEEQLIFDGDTLHFCRY